MEGALKKKRQRDEFSDNLHNTEDLKQGRISAADVDCKNLVEQSPDYYYYCCVLDEDHRGWRSDDGRGSGIQAMAIRKQSYMQDCFNGGDNKSEEAEDLGLDVKDLWIAESPLCEGATQEPLFGDYHFGFFEDQTTSVSAFRFWDEDYDQKNQTMHGKDLEEYEYDDELFAESVELESL